MCLGPPRPTSSSTPSTPCISRSFSQPPLPPATPPSSWLGGLPVNPPAGASTSPRWPLPPAVSWNGGSGGGLPVNLVGPAVTQQHQQHPPLGMARSWGGPASAPLGGFTPHCKENPIYVFLFWELRGLGPNFHIYTCVCERFIYSQDWSTYFPAAE